MARRPTGAARSSARQRGYALVLVTLLTMVSSMAVAVILQRHAAVSRSVQRQMEHTRQRHIERGLRELLSGWLRTVRGESVAERLGPDGHALDIELPGGVVSVFLRDAQGAALGNFDGLPDDEVARAQALREALAQRVGRSALEQYTRLVGPPKISVIEAAPEVLEAAIEAALGAAQAPEIAAKIREAVAAGPVSDVTMRNQTLATAGLEPPDRATLMRSITAEPELWELDIRVSGSRGGETGRYRGLVVIPRRQSGARQGSIMSFSPLGPFLHWERVALE